MKGWNAITIALRALQRLVSRTQHGAHHAPPPPVRRARQQGWLTVLRVLDECTDGSSRFLAAEEPVGSAPLSQESGPFLSGEYFLPILAL